MQGRNRKRGKRARRSLENPAVPLNWNNLEDDDTRQAFGMSSTAAGVSVTERKALGYPAVWRAVNLIAGDVAKLSLLVYRTTGEGKAVDSKHAAYRLCRYKANPYLLAFEFRRVVQLHALLRGNGFGYIDRDGAGRPMSLNVMDSDKVEVGRVDGRVWYKYTPAAAGLDAILIPAEDVFHIRGLGDDGLEGYPALEVLRESIGAAIASRDFGARTFKNDARPGGVLSHPGSLKPQAVTNMRESWERLHRGVDNAHKVAILQEGVTFTPIASTARDAQLLESREFDSREIANIFGVPAHKLGDPSKVAYNSLGEENQSYYNDTLSHWLCQWSAEASDKLLSEQEKAAESHTVDFDYREVQRANLQTLTAYATAACGKWASVDETRGLFGDNPLPGGKGKWQEPQPAPVADPPADPADPPARSLTGLRAVVEDTARRMAKRIIGDAGKYRGDPAGFAEWVGSRYHYHAGIVRQAFEPAALLCLEAGAGMDSAGFADLLWRTCRQGVIDAGPAHLEAGADALVNHAAAFTADILTGTKE
jgi:HK97 family phage portal protein